MTSLQSAPPALETAVLGGMLPHRQRQARRERVKWLARSSRINATASSKSPCAATAWHRHTTSRTRMMEARETG